MAESTTRLNKFIALSLGTSRREADDLIEKGKVLVDTEPARLGQQIRANAIVEVAGKRLSPSTKLQYIALNKPSGYVSSRAQQGDTPTIYSLLPKDLHALKPVGRLDKDSSGLLLLTNDGDFAHSMTHPSFHKTKTYEVTLDKDLEPLHQQMISDFGVELEDGRSQLTLEKIGEESRKRWKVSMHEGRNRQIRRTFLTLGYTVKKLHRTQFGSYSLAQLELKKSEWCKVQIS